MRILGILLAFVFGGLLTGCKTQASKDYVELDRQIEDRARFMRENRSAVRILKVDDDGCERRVEVQGIRTKESTWANFKKRQEPKPGEIWRIAPVADRRSAWFELSSLGASLED